jgi:hypothetical protein
MENSGSLDFPEQAQLSRRKAYFESALHLLIAFGDDL